MKDTRLWPSDPSKGKAMLMEQMWLLARYLFWRIPGLGRGPRDLWSSLSRQRCPRLQCCPNQQQQQQKQTPLTQPLSSAGPTAESRTWSPFRLTEQTNDGFSDRLVVCGVLAVLLALQRSLPCSHPAPQGHTGHREGRRLDIGSETKEGKKRRGQI